MKCASLSHDYQREAFEGRNMQDAFKETNAGLQALAELDNFARVVSLDLKAPLVSISGFAEMLREQYGDRLDATARGVLANILSGTGRMELLVNDLLTYAQVAARAGQFATVDCGAIVEDALSNLGMMIDCSGAEISRNDLPTMNGDRTQLARLFQNLVDNALKYRGARTPRIHVSAEPIRDISDVTFEDPRMQSAVRAVCAAKETGWLFSVTDNGIGIDAVHFDRIFQTFQRLHADEKKYPGTGIGLAISKKIVERHGGRIWVDSEPGMGSTFYFTLRECRTEGRQDA